jgi:S1-C subfamily serine protease
MADWSAPGPEDEAPLDAYSRVVAGYGLGLAVPVDATSLAIIAALMQQGRVRRAYLGVAGRAQPLPERLAATLGRGRGLRVVCDAELRTVTAIPAELPAA